MINASQCLQYNFENHFAREEILNTPDDSELGYLVKVYLKSPGEKESRTKS